MALVVQKAYLRLEACHVKPAAADDVATSLVCPLSVVVCGDDVVTLLASSQQIIKKHMQKKKTYLWLKRRVSVSFWLLSVVVRPLLMVVMTWRLTVTGGRGRGGQDTLQTGECRQHDRECWLSSIVVTRSKNLKTKETVSQQLITKNNKKETYRQPKRCDQYHLGLGVSVDSLFSHFFVAELCSGLGCGYVSRQSSTVITKGRDLKMKERRYLLMIQHYVF